MIAVAVRLLKRLLVLLAGVAVIYIAVWKIYPFFDKRIPVTLALLATYIVSAYLLAPAVLRLVRLFVHPSHIPLYCVTPDGFASDPVNIGIVGSREELIEAMQKAGWHLADKRTLRTIARMIFSAATGRPYPTAPFSTLYLFGRKQDIGFELPLEGSNTHRHHVRFWACHLDGPEAFHGHVRFWQRFHRLKGPLDTRQLWVGAASKDIGLRLIRHNAQLTHMIHPDTNAERDLIVEHLRAAHQVAKTQTVKVGSPYELRNRAFLGLLRADGKLRICILKP
jgi:hypothetical protein